jgi:hypothetical protein
VDWDLLEKVAWRAKFEALSGVKAHVEIAVFDARKAEGRVGQPLRPPGP